METCYLLVSCPFKVTICDLRHRGEIMNAYISYTYNLKITNCDLKIVTN